MRLFVVVDRTESFLQYTVKHSGGSTSGNIHLLSSSGYSLQSFDLDLSSFENVTSVTVSEPYYNVAYVALVPEDATFEAISYNLDGSVFCKFDQNGSMELYEYDTAGWVIRVKDQHGNVLKDYQHNVAKLN